MASKSSATTDGSYNRAYQRVEIVNLVAYSCCIQPENESYGYGVGRVINLSKGGMLIETPEQISLAEHVHSTCFNKRGGYTRADGQLVYSRVHAETGRYVAGIAFSDSGEAVDRFISGLVGGHSLLKRDNVLPVLLDRILSRRNSPRDEYWGLRILRKFFEHQARGVLTQKQMDAEGGDRTEPASDGTRIYTDPLYRGR